MKIGEEVQVSYDGLVHGKHVFVKMSMTGVIKVPEDKLFGSSVLKDTGKYKLKRNTYSQYTVSAD